MFREFFLGNEPTRKGWIFLPRLLRPIDDIALWDIVGKVANLPIHKLIGGAHWDRLPVYGYSMMLRRESVSSLLKRFGAVAVAVKDSGFVAVKMKVGLGVRDDVKLARAVRRAIGGLLHIYG